MEFVTLHVIEVDPRLEQLFMDVLSSEPVIDLRWWRAHRVFVWPLHGGVVIALLKYDPEELYLPVMDEVIYISN